MPTRISRMRTTDTRTEHTEQHFTEKVSPSTAHLNWTNSTPTLYAVSIDCTDHTTSAHGHGGKHMPNVFLVPNDLLVILQVMLLSGTAGGLVNRFLTEGDIAPRLAWWKHVIIGIAAAFMVPLFLAMISADLITKIRGTAGHPGDPALLLNLAGFCLVAAVSSRGFIQSVSDQMLREVREARQQASAALIQAQQAGDTAEQARLRALDATQASLLAQSDASTAQELIRAQWPEESQDVQEPTAAASGDTFLPRKRSRSSHNAPPLESTPALAHEMLVLLALSEGNTPLRSVSGLAHDSRLAEATVMAVLGHLQQKAWALSLPGSDGQPRWFATATGKAQTQVAMPA